MSVHARMNRSSEDMISVIVVSRSAKGGSRVFPRLRVQLPALSNHAIPLHNCVFPRLSFDSFLSQLRRLRRDVACIAFLFAFDERPTR